LGWLETANQRFGVVEVSLNIAVNAWMAMRKLYVQLRTLQEQAATQVQALKL
jgi:hypothetical protein